MFTHHITDLMLRQKRIVKITASAVIASIFLTKRIIDLLPYALGRGRSTVTDIELERLQSWKRFSLSLPTSLELRRAMPALTTTVNIITADYRNVKPVSDAPFEFTRAFILTTEIPAAKSRAITMEAAKIPQCHSPRETESRKDRQLLAR
jgi:hypothetical protein